MKKTSVTMLLALPALLLAHSAFADFVCDTNSGDGRNFSARGKTQADAQLAAFNTCNAAGHTLHRACERNMSCSYR